MGEAIIMIKIVKQGETIFKMVCPQCDCIYTYEIGDILTGGTYCPCCDEFNLHSARKDNDALSNTVDNIKYERNTNQE